MFSEWIMSKGASRLICGLLALGFCFYAAYRLGAIREESKVMDPEYTRSVAMRLQAETGDYVFNDGKSDSGDKDLSYETVYINLDRQSDRMKRLEASLKDQGFSGHKRFSAIEGARLDVSLLVDLGVIDQGMSLALGYPSSWFKSSRQRFKPGQLGVMLSHLLVLKESLQTEGSYLLVLEDDVILPPGFTETVKEVVLQLAESKFDLVQLSGSSDINLCAQPKFNFLHTHVCRDSLDPRRDMEPSSLIQPARFSIGTWAYIIKKSSIPKFINHFSLPLLERPVWMGQSAPIKYWGPLDIYQWLLDDIKIATLYPYVIDISQTVSWVEQQSSTGN